MAVASTTTPAINPSMVYIDTVNGFALSGAYMTSLIGNPTMPVNNLTDARTIAAQRLTNNFHVKNPLVLDQDLTPYNFFGDGDWYISYLNLNFHDIPGCTFNGLGVLGSSPSYLVADGCFVSGDIIDYTIYAQITGDLKNCTVGSIQPVPLSSGINCYNCTSQGYPYQISLAGGGQLGWSGGGGDVEIYNMDNAACLLVIISQGSGLFVDTTCVLGTIQVGIVAYEYYFAGPGVTKLDYWQFAAGKIVPFNVTVNGPANHGAFTLATAYNVQVQIESVALRATADVSADLTSAPVYAFVGTAVTLTIIDPVKGARANIALKGMQVNSAGPWVLYPGERLVGYLNGTGPTTVHLDYHIVYIPLNNTAYLK